MKHLYIVNPVKHQPHWGDTPQPAASPCRLRAIVVRVLGIVFVADLLYVAYLLVGRGL